jgi:hypothetical protein
MIQVSSEYLNKIQAGRRKVFGMVKIGWADPYFMKDSYNYNVSSTTTKAGCLPQQIINEGVSNTRKWKHFDGVTSFADRVYPAPSNISMAMGERGELGWWSSVLSNSTGYFTPVLKLNIIHAIPKTVFDVVVMGDDAYEEFPINFKVRLYSAEGAYSFYVTDNILSSWRGVVSDDIKKQAGTVGVFDYRYVTRMELEISKWNKPNRLAKITTFTAINEMTFTGDDIFTIDLTEELEVSEGSLPVGTASANEVDVSFNNIFDKFCTGNAESEIRNVLLPNRKIRPFLGVQLTEQVYEWVPLGTFWSQGWSVQESSLMVTVTARDRMDLLRQMRYLGCPVQKNLSLYDLAVQVLEAARVKLPDLEYNIDPSYKEIVIPICFLPAANYMDTIKAIVTAGLGHAYVDRNDVIQVCGSSQFSTMKPWALGPVVWVFDDGSEVIGELCQHVFTTAGTHKGILYLTEELTGQVVSKEFHVEVRDIDIETPYRAEFTTESGEQLLGCTFEKTNSSPLRYTLTFNSPIIETYKVTVFSQSGKYYDTRALLIEVRNTEGSLLTLASEDEDVAVFCTSPLLYSLTWSHSGTKKIDILVAGLKSRDLRVEVRPDIQAAWVVSYTG